MAESWQGTLVTDSQSVLLTLGGSNKMFKETDKPLQIDGNTVVLDVLCPDWDIYIEIQEALSHIPGLWLKFIKGHRDDNTPYARLPFLARLNVNADAMAGKFKDKHGQERPMVLLTPRTRALLHLTEGTVTRILWTTIKGNICQRNNWTEAEVESINWQAHGSALRRKIPRRIHFVKLVHNILPTHSWQNKPD